VSTVILTLVCVLARNLFILIMLCGKGHYYDVESVAVFLLTDALAQMEVDCFVRCCFWGRSS
jgi:hypothetical protein